MYREMRRKDRQTSEEDAIKLFQECKYGVLSTSDSSNMPYGVPISYIYMDGSIYFHSATEGHKLDNIKTNDNVSFCVVGDTTVLPDKFSTVYKSAIAFGTASFIDDTEEKNKVLYGFIEKYSADFRESGKKYIEKAAVKTNIVKIKLEHITGKQRIE